MSAGDFRRAVETHDAAAVRRCLSDDVVFNSPVVHTPYRGIDTVAPLLAAAVDVFEDFRYLASVSEGDREVLVFEARVGDRSLQGVDLIRLDPDGRVAELTVMLRPRSGLEAMAEAMGRRLART